MSSDPSLSLQEVLRRCHRDEMLALAEILKVNPLGLGRDRLASVLDTALRAAGTNRVKNLVLHMGEGPEYPTVLAELSQRQGLEPPAHIDAAELGLLQKWREKGVSDSEQAESLELVLGTTSTVLVPSSRKRSIPKLATIIIGFLYLFAPLIGPLAAIGLVLWLSRPRDEILLPAVLQVAMLREKVAKRLTIGVVGPPSSGKDAAMRAIFGIHTGNIHPKAGSTKEVAVYRLESDLQVVNTPGVGDVLEELTEETRAVLDQIDLFLFLVNAQGGVRTREKNEYMLCRSRQRPILVLVNKIDTLKPSDQERFVEDVRSKLNLRPASTILATAFDPLIPLDTGPIGVEEAREWLRVELKKLGRDPVSLNSSEQSEHS